MPPHTTLPRSLTQRLGGAQAIPEAQAFERMMASHKLAAGIDSRALCGTVLAAHPEFGSRLAEVARKYVPTIEGYLSSRGFSESEAMKNATRGVVKRLVRAERQEAVDLLLAIGLVDELEHFEAAEERLLRGTNPSRIHAAMSAYVLLEGLSIDCFRHERACGSHVSMTDISSALLTRGIVWRLSSISTCAPISRPMSIASSNRPWLVSVGGPEKAITWPSSREKPLKPSATCSKF
jgi:hypothetical protein